MARLHALGIPLALLIAATATAAPTRNVHSMTWYVHVDLLNPGAGEDLSYFQALLEDRLAEANRLVQGHQGPVDTGCCVELDPVTVTPFGTAGDGINEITTLSELNVVLGPGALPGAYLVERVNYCSGFGTSIRGCASTPGDRLVVGFEADDNGFLPTVIAHELGHNTGLFHVSANPCELMAASSGGGCISVSECNSFIADADTTSGTCECLADTLGDPPTAPGTTCTDPVTAGAGICNGGSCGVPTGEAGSRLLASGGTGAATGNSPNALLEMSTLTGDWDDNGAFGVEINGLAYDETNDVLYGVEARAGDDALVIIDDATGTVTSTVGVLTGRDNVIALAFDPQPSGDRLFAIDNDDTIFGTPCAAVPASPNCSSELFEIDATTASTTSLGELNFLLVENGVQGLAWDDATSTLYGSTRAGLVSLDLAPCNGSACNDNATNIDSPPGQPGTFYGPSSLAFDSVSGRVIRVGHNGIGQVREDLLDPTGSAERRIRGIEGFTAGGLAVKPVPEPAASLGLAVGALALAALRRGQRR